MMVYTILFFIALALCVLIFWPLRNNRLLLLIVCPVFLGGSLGVYALIGKPDIVDALHERQIRLAELTKRINHDSDAVKADPRNIEAWIRLGGSFMETTQYSAAANAFKQAVLLTGGAPELIMAYAKALIASQNGDVDEQSKKSLEMVLLQKPDHQEARYWLIVRRVQQGEGETAMADMQALYRSLADDSPLKAMINRQIGRN